MHLYLKNGNQQRWLVINLVDGNIPKIVGLSSQETSEITNNLEPAIWFKVMLLESVSIDCTTRVVSWTNGQHHEGMQNNNAPATYSLFGNSASCYDFDDDIDELFTIATDLIENHPLMESDEKIRKEKIFQYEQSLFRMMHCYILSKIAIEPRDLPCVIKALNAQKKVITQLDDQTLVHSRLAEYYTSKMTNIREFDIAPSIETLLESKMINKQLAEILLFDIKKAETLLRQEVDSVQKMVDMLKGGLLSAETKENRKNLSAARELRDIKHRKLETLIVTKAIIENSFTFLNDTNEQSDLCRHYLNLHSRVLDEKKLLKFYMDQKVRALSVRECIQSVISDLEKGLESCGEEFTIDGKRITDDTMLRSPAQTYVRYIATDAKRLRLEGKVAIITASTNGIGYSIAECFAENGAKVLISSRKKENVDKSVLTLKEKGYDVRGIVCHVGKSMDRKNLVEKALKDFGKIDIFVSNAAVNPVACPLLDTPEEAWDKIFELNLKSSFMLAKETVPYLSKTRGSMLFVASVAGFMPMPLLGAYSISKTALLSLVKVLSAECALNGVRVNGLAPGIIKTDFSSFLTSSDQISSSFLEQVPMRRFGEAAECAGAALFLSSDEASYITGETIVIGGGYNCRL